MSPEETHVIKQTGVSPELPGGRIIPSAALIGVGLLLEPELLGGALIGAGVVYGLPLVAQILRPVATTAVQLGYSAVASVGDLLAGARHEVEGIVANARAGYQRPPGSSIISDH
ncbi:MAG TPA: hypothetical protein VJQ54_10695 [Candidatus Sulfotelmatobacter sp.]|nr:hypothetical protein [Candidatus Sulfotelmatobacter sp.]